MSPCFLGPCTTCRHIPPPCPVKSLYVHTLCYSVSTVTLLLLPSLSVLLFPSPCVICYALFSEHDVPRSQDNMTVAVCKLWSSTITVVQNQTLKNHFISNFKKEYQQCIKLTIKRVSKVWCNVLLIPLNHRNANGNMNTNEYLLADVSAHSGSFTGAPSCLCECPGSIIW